MRTGLIVLIVLGLFLVMIISGCFTVVDPGMRGVKVTLGTVSSSALSEGLHIKSPMITTIHEVSVRQNTRELNAPCFSSDLQAIVVHIKVLWKIPEKSVVAIYQQYAGDPMDTLIAPRVQEAVKEVTALETAEGIVKHRESIKSKSLALASAKIGPILDVVDLVIENIDLSKDLENAIEQKMVQEQEAAKAKFTQQKAQIDSETLVIRADAEARAIKIRGLAIKENPMLIDLQIAEKWNGVAPLVVGGNGGAGANVLLPLK